MCRHHALLGTLSNVSPVHWQYGAIARLNKNEPIDKLLKNGYSSISLGYIGIYEMTKLMTDTYGNPSSLYSVGQKAKEVLEEARDDVADVINGLFKATIGETNENWDFLREESAE